MNTYGQIALTRGFPPLQRYFTDVGYEHLLQIQAQEAVAEWNTAASQVDPLVKFDGWRPVGELRVWLLAEDGWWGLVAGRDGVRWMRAANLRQSSPDMPNGSS